MQKIKCLGLHVLFIITIAPAKKTCSNCTEAQEAILEAKVEVMQYSCTVIGLTPADSVTYMNEGGSNSTNCGQQLQTISEH
jgi:hypothetical protein